MTPPLQALEYQLLQGPNQFAPRSVLCLWLADPAELTVEQLDRLGHELDDVLRTELHVDPVAADDTPDEPLRRRALLLGRLTLALQAAIGRPLRSCQPITSGARVGAAVEYEEPAVAVAALELSHWLVSALIAAGTDDASVAGWRSELKRRFETFSRQAAGARLDLTTAALVEAAVARDIPWRRLVPEGRIVVLGQGRHQCRILETVTDRTSSIAEKLQRDKHATSLVLRALGIPASACVVVTTTEEAVQAAERMGYPVVLKPNNLGGGKGVAVNLKGPHDVRAAFVRAARRGGPVIVEPLIPGDDHRLLTVDGCLIAAARKIPAFVVGDGESPIRDLIARVNLDPRRGRGFEKLMTELTMDEEVTRILAEQGFTVDGIPAAGLTVWLRGTANISTGGTAEDVTDHVHPDNRRLAERAVRAVGLDIAGLDFITPDISRSWREVGGTFIEVNAFPGLRPHQIANPNRDVTGPILDALFPPGRPARVPIAMVTGSNGKSTTCRMVAAILGQMGWNVALTTTDGAFIAGEMVSPDDVAGGAAASSLLMDPTVDAGVFEIARGGLLRRGLVLDGCSVGALLNVYEDHVGTDGIDSLEEMAHLKGLVIRHARDWAVVNADDPLCLAQAGATRARSICMVSRELDNPTVRAHRGSGGAAVVLEPGNDRTWIVLRRGDASERVVAVEDIPMTYGGRAAPKVANALFAAAIAFGLGMSVPIIRTGLTSRGTDFADNPGRLTVIDSYPFRLILDYAIDPRAMEATMRFVEHFPALGRRICVLTAPGNRPDAYIEAIGRAAAGFDRYLLCSWEDLRGRAPHDVPALLAKGLASAGVASESMADAGLRPEALEKIAREAQPGDLVLVISYAPADTWRRLRSILGEPSRPPSERLA